MTIELASPEASRSLPRRLSVWLLRTAGIVLFGLGIWHWVRLIGIYDGPLWRFDLMPFWWKVATPALAVLYPVAGIGLWMLATWGIVIWVLIALIEAVRHLAFSELFGDDPFPLLFHVAGLVVLLGLRLWDWRRKPAGRRRR